MNTRGRRGIRERRHKATEAPSTNWPSCGEGTATRWAKVTVGPYPAQSEYASGSSLRRNEHGSAVPYST